MTTSNRLASRRYSASSDGQGIEFEIELFRPEPAELGGYECIISHTDIAELGRGVSVWGEDELEALSNAIHVMFLKIRIFHEFYDLGDDWQSTFPEPWRS